ncbi:phage tail sheath family protein [Candidatus Uabimicrobium sp. HlEnr_7]|uniref:phage tail sheath family protein n=1 Tax=Candidatus Uabimicrobium helgolandensis TaxID=3095367 RepID=UPI003555EAF4
MPLTPGVYIQEVSSGSKPIESVGTSTAAFLGVPTKEGAVLHTPTLVTSWSQFSEKFGGLPKELPNKPEEMDNPYVPEKLLPYAVYQFFAEGGSKCYIVGISDASEATQAEPKKGLKALDPIEDVNMIATPDAKGEKSLMMEGISYCAKRKNCVFIADSNPELLDAQSVQQEYAEAFSTSSYGALYYPWIHSLITPQEVKNKIKVMLPPSGAIAGIYARADSTVGVHKAPAGLKSNVRTARGLAYTMTHGEQENLNANGINAIRSFPGKGIVVWGARTLATTTDAEWKYINVRRLFIYVEESLKRGMQWAVFEPNSPRVWGSIKRNIRAFLWRVWQDGALFGKTEDEAFFIKVDKENNPQPRRDAGELIVDIAIAPVKPAEFVIIRISQKVLES